MKARGAVRVGVIATAVVSFVREGVGRASGSSPIAGLLLWLVGVVLTSSGCGATCDRNPDKPAVRHTAGRTDRAAGFYESSPPEGPFLDFPAGRTYELVHELGAVPEVIPYISFDRCPLPEPCEPGDEEASNVTLAAGNIVVFEAIDDERIVVRNDTCSDIRLRVVAMLSRAPIRATDAGL